MKKAYKYKHNQKETKVQTNMKAKKISKHDEDSRREYLKMFINTVVDAIPLSSIISSITEANGKKEEQNLKCEIILQGTIASLSQTNIIRVWIEKDKTWVKKTLDDKINDRMTNVRRMQCCNVNSNLDSWKDLMATTSIKQKGENDGLILRSIVTSFRCDLLQEQSTNQMSNKENNVLQHLQSFLQHVTNTEHDATVKHDTIVEMMNACSLYLLNPKSKSSSSMLYFVIEPYTQLIMHYMNLSAIENCDKLAAFSTILVSLHKNYQEKFCAYMLRSMKQDGNDANATLSTMIWDICKIIQMTLSSSPRLIGTTQDQLDKFMEWSDDVFNQRSSKKRKELDSSTDKNDVDASNNNHPLDTSAYDRYLLDDDESSEEDTDSSDDGDESKEDTDSSQENEEGMQDSVSDEKSEDSE